MEWNDHIVADWLDLQEYDATLLVLKNGPSPKTILIDQGSEDSFLHDKQLLPEAFEVLQSKSQQSAPEQLSHIASLCT